MKKLFLNWTITKFAEAVIAVIAAVICFCIIKMLPQTLEHILPPVIFNKEHWIDLCSEFTIRRLWALLFGIRFVISFLVSGVGKIED